MLKNVFKPIFQLAASQINRLGIMDRLRFVTLNFDTIDRKMQPSDKWQLRNFLFRYRFSEWPLVPASKQLRNYGIFRLVDALSGVDGDFVEAGVGYGNSLLTMAYACAFFGVRRKIYGFDSFEGFPTPSAEDLGTRVTRLDARPSGWDDTSPDMILRAFTEGWDLDPEKKAWVESIQLVPGFFEKTMPGKLPAKIAFLHIDCDLYEPVLHVLTHCIGRMAAGGVIIFDEYHDQKWPGAKKAADAFCADHGLSIVFFRELQRYGISIKG